MTIQESTICSLVQAFPILLIMAQNHNRCLKTPLIYKPPSPTPSTEYYEALDALFNSLFGHGYQEHHGYPGCGNTNYYGKKYVQTPCYYYPSQVGHDYGTSHGQSHGVSFAYPSYYGYSRIPSYGYKKVSMYNVTGTHGYKGTYAPTQVYNMNHKYKVVVKRNKPKGQKRKPQKLQMEPCQVEGYQGSCIPILSCDPYVKMLQQSKSNPAVAQLLRRAHCGFEGNYPKVCCPIPGIPDYPPPPPSPDTTTTPIPTSPVPEPKADQTDATDFVSSLPEPPVCGTSNASFSRVVGGVDAKLGDFPWMALLGYKKARGNTDWLCGGSLITSKHVLTASHCIHGHETQLYVVRVGELDLARENEGATPVDVLIKKQIKHEDYNSNSFTNDIGLLLLDRDVQFTSLIKPICLPRSSELRSNTFENYTPLVAGWGSLEFRGPSAQILQVLQLPVVGNDFCRDAYKAYAKQVIDDRVLCAGYKKGGKDACQGDSGGPLMQPIWNSQTLKTFIYQIGVVSFGKKCAEPGFPGVYSRITTFIPWLEEKLLGPSK